MVPAPAESPHVHTPRKQCFPPTPGRTYTYIPGPRPAVFQMPCAKGAPVVLQPIVHTPPQTPRPLSIGIGIGGSVEQITCQEGVVSTAHIKSTLSGQMPYAGSLDMTSPARQHTSLELLDGQHALMQLKGREKPSPEDDLDPRLIIGEPIETSLTWGQFWHLELGHLSFQALAAVMMALPLIAGGQFRHGAATVATGASFGDAVGEHIAMTLCLLVCMIASLDCVMPALFISHGLLDFCLSLTFSIPFTLTTSFFPMVDGFNPDHFMIYNTLVPIIAAFALPGPLLWMSVLNLNGIEGYFNPKTWLKPFTSGHKKAWFLDVVAFSLCFSACVFPGFAILFDMVFLASGRWGHIVKEARPVIMAIVRMACYLLMCVGADRLGTTHKMYGLWTACYGTGMIKAFSCTQTKSWGSLISFLVLDWAEFSFKMMRVLYLSGALDDYNFFKVFHRLFVFGKPSEPHPMPKAVFRSYQLMVESTCISIGLLAFAILYPVAKHVVSHDMLSKFLFPIDDSIYYLAVLYINDYMQDQVVRVFVARKMGYHFSPIFNGILNMVFVSEIRYIFRSIFIMSWVPMYLTWFGWQVQYEKIGPFAEG